MSIYHDFIQFHNIKLCHNKNIRGYLYASIVKRLHIPMSLKYGNSKSTMNGYSMVWYYPVFKYSLCKKFSLAFFYFFRDTLVWATAYKTAKL